MVHHNIEYLIFQTGQRHGKLLTVHIHFRRLRVHFHRTAVENLADMAPAAQHVFDPGYQLPVPKGLNDIIVRSQIKGPYHRLLLLSGRKKNHRQLLLPADFAPQPETVAVRQRDIQKGQIIPLPDNRPFCFRRRTGGVKPEALLLQQIFQSQYNRLIVLNQKKLHFRLPCGPNN